jgi:hypothetical protein
MPLCRLCGETLPKSSFSGVQLKKCAARRCAVCIAAAVVHHGYFCDASGVEPIIGNRYHLAGWDIDLCEAEHAKLAEFDQKRFAYIASADTSTCAAAFAEAPPASILADLRAADSGLLALPEAATFEPLLPTAVDMALSSVAALEFSEHTSFAVPHESSDEVDVVHRFRLKHSARLNAGLERWALHKEQQAALAAANAPEQVAGVRVSNRGGFQSAPDLFIKPAPPLPGEATAAPAKKLAEEALGRRCCRALHALVSAAVDIINGDEGSTSAAEQLTLAERGDGSLRHDALGWINLIASDDL